MKRKPSATGRTTKLISELLPEALQKIGALASEPTEAIFHYWLELLGEKMAPFTEPVSFVNGVLTVKVKSSTLYSLLSQYEKPRLMKQLNEKFQVQKLVFRIGS